MQLEDFNHAMLRAIYAFYLVFFGLLVLVYGIVMIPFGYLAVLVVRARLIYREIQDKRTIEFLMTKRVQLKEEDRVTHSISQFFSFLFTGLF